MTKYRKPFYANEMHNDSNFSVHRYFTTNIEGHGRSKLKQFVDVPCPFGVENTYKYLRRANLNKLPFLTEPKPKKHKSILLATLHTNVSKRDSRAFSCHYTNKTFETFIENKRPEFIIKVCMYQEI